VQAGGWVWRGLGVWDKTRGCRPLASTSVAAPTGAAVSPEPAGNGLKGRPVRRAEAPGPSGR
jgi:hypothetical protein